MTDLSTPAASARLWAVDFESTGTVAGYPDQPWQLALVPVIDGTVRPGDAFETYLRIEPGRPFSPFAPGSWIEKRAILADAPELSSLAASCSSRIGAAPLVAHNTATEKKFFRKAWPLHRPGPWIDTLKLARIAFPGLASYELETLIQSVGLSDQLNKLLPGRISHDALYDATACALLLGRMLEDTRWRVRSVGDLVLASGGRVR